MQAVARALSWTVQVGPEGGPYLPLPTTALAHPWLRVVWAKTWPGGGRLLLLGWLCFVDTHTNEPAYLPTLGFEYTGRADRVEDTLFIVYLSLGRLFSLALGFPLTIEGLLAYGPLITHPIRGGR